MKRVSVLPVLLGLVLLCSSLSGCMNASVPEEKTAAKQEAALPPDQAEQALSGIQSIAVGRIFDGAGYGWKPGISYAIDKNGAAWYWGYFDQSIAFPERLQGVNHVQQISGIYILDTDGQVWQQERLEAPKQVKELQNIKAIQQLDEVGGGILYLLKKDGTLWQWDRNSLKPLLGFSKVRGIYGSAFSLFVVDEQGKLYYLEESFLANRGGQALAIPLSDNVADVAVDHEDHALVRTATDEMYEFNAREKTINRIPQADGAKSMAVVNTATYVIAKSDGTVWGWGENENGILGANQPAQVDNPVPITGLADIASLQAGTDHVLALDKSGYVYSWGSNMTGQLGRVPVLFDKWTEVAELKNVAQVETKIGKPYFLREDGSIWGLSVVDWSPYQVKGASGIQTVTSVQRIPITLDKDGKVLIWSREFTEPKPLAIPFKAKRIIGGEEHLLLQKQDNQLVTIQFTRGDDGEPAYEKIVVSKADPSWTSKVKALYENLYTFFVLTEDGSVYFGDKKEGQPFTFKRISGLEQIKKLAPEAFVHHTMDPASVWALDHSGRVHEIVVKRVPDDVSPLQAIEVTVNPVSEKDIADVSGKLRITTNNDLFEHEWSSLQKQRIPEAVRLISSAYDYSIEGPGSHYHVLVTKNGKLVVIGYNPFGHMSAVPAKVRTPKSK